MQLTGTHAFVVSARSVPPSQWASWVLTPDEFLTIRDTEKALPEKLKLRRKLTWNITFYGNWDNRPPPGFASSDYGASSGVSWKFGNR
jgi:hypothetical protein